MITRMALLLCGSLLLQACIPAVEIRKSIDDSAIAEQARQNTPVKWKTALGVSVIESMLTLNSKHILLMLKDDKDILTNGDIVLLARDTGAIQWRYSRALRAGDYSFILETDQHLLFQINNPNSTQLVALDVLNGREKWFKEFHASTVQFYPLPKADSLFVTEQQDASVKWYGVNPYTGKTEWTQVFQIKNKTPPPVVSSGDIWSFYNGVEKINGKTGEKLWRQDSIKLNAQTPLPQIYGDTLYLVDAKNVLHALATQSCKTKFSTRLNSDQLISNIYPTAQRLYLRGSKKQGPAANVPEEERIRKAAYKAAMQSLGFSTADGNEYLLLAFSNKNGKAQWSSTDSEPSVSNILENGNGVFHATASRLISLDRNNGKQRFSKAVTNAGRDFPVHLRLIGNNAVFLGEWIVAAFDQKTGEQKYSQGMNPVPDSRATMAGLDDTVTRLKQELGASSPQSMELASSLSQDASRFQNMANHYHQLASNYRSMARSTSGSTSEHYAWKALTSQNQATIEGAFSSAYNTIALNVAIWEFNAQMEKAFHLSNVQAAIADASLFRKALLNGFSRFENRDYYYRPHDDFNGFVGVSIVNLNNGKRSDVMLSPGYQDYGLWNLIDFDKGMIYHHGIGLDVNTHRYIEQPRGMNTFMVYGSYLIAQPVKLP